MRQQRLRIGWTWLGAAVAVGLGGVFAVAAAQEPSSTRMPEPSPSHAAASTSRPLVCASPGPVIDVGSSWQDQPPSRFTVTAGTYRLIGSDFLPPAPVPLTPSDWTYALLGPGDTTPLYDRARGTMNHQTMGLTVAKDEPALTHLAAGRYWLVNTWGATLALQPCDGGTVSNVALPHPGR